VVGCGTVRLPVLPTFRLAVTFALKRNGNGTARPLHSSFGSPRARHTAKSSSSAGADLTESPSPPALVSLPMRF
jgi:hypothetical protein